METLTLVNGKSYLEIQPEIGGSISRYSTENELGNRDWMRPAGEKGQDGDILGFSCFPLVPFSSRIRDGIFRFQGQDCSLPLNFLPEKHTIHGHGWKVPWQVLDQTADKALLQYVHLPDEWPWSYRVFQFFDLEEEKFSVKFELLNTSDTPMPAGIGLHPYFVRTPLARVRANCEGMWVNDEDVMPLLLDSVPPDRNICEGLEVETGFIDNTFTGWDHRAWIEWPEWNARLLIESETPMDFLVVYAPLKENFFCVEPVSNVTDAFNMMARGEPGHGTRVLKAQESLKSRVIFSPKFGL